MTPARTMLMVPPNLTGDLHLGHALMLAMQDCLARHWRRSGSAVAYVPGFDHAGIGLYAAVTRTPGFRPDLPVGRRLRAWASSCRERQRRQMRAFDVTCDWSQELYTLAPRYGRVVRAAFGRLAADGLVHRDHRELHWCPRCATTISDMEAVTAQPGRPAVCGRCDHELTRRQTWQWFVRMGPLAGPLLDALARGDVRLEPESATREAAEWLTDAEDWCVSRQIPWGHRIPAFRCPGCAGWSLARGRCCDRCGAALVAETDVLDTWFSSSLWFLATAGWPDAAGLAGRTVPVITTGRDILFFWLLRSLAISRHLAGAWPSGCCYLHGLVLDANGQKMSKSRGNVIGLRDACAEHGPDAVRSGLLAGCHGGQDIRLTPALLRRQTRAGEVLAALAGLPREDAGPRDSLDHWLAWHACRAERECAEHLEELRFAAAMDVLNLLVERVVAPYVAVRRAEAGCVSAAVAGRLGALFEPVMPRVAAALPECGLAEPDPDRATAAESWMAAVRELTQLRGPLGLGAAAAAYAAVPPDAAASLADETWPARGTPLRPGPPADRLVEWRFELAAGEASLYLPPEHAGRMRSEAARRLRAEQKRHSGLRRRAPGDEPPPALAAQLALSESRIALHRRNLEDAEAAERTM